MAWNKSFSVTPVKIRIYFLISDLWISECSSENPFCAFRDTFELNPQSQIRLAASASPLGQPKKCMDAVLGCGKKKRKKVPVRRFQHAAPRRLKRRSNLNFHRRLSASEKPISGREPCLLSPCESSECSLGWHSVSRPWLATVIRDPITV